MNPWSTTVVNKQFRKACKIIFLVRTVCLLHSWLWSCNSPMKMTAVWYVKKRIIVGTPHFLCTFWSGQLFVWNSLNTFIHLLWRFYNQWCISSSLSYIHTSLAIPSCSLNMLIPIRHQYIKPRPVGWFHYTPPSTNTSTLS